ncbi:MAG: C1 family peptidase, partial [Deltaproteobacteria bacterium]|nr:C1 family peptidase [Deltaproteobacteria bacterium]
MSVTTSLGRRLGLSFGSVLGRQIALGACRDDEEDDLERRPFRPRVPLASLPPAVDLRPWMTPVEDQGQLGSCTANALVGAMEYLAYRETGARTDLSRLFVYFNQRLWDDTVREDLGARVSDGVRVLVRLGVATERSWPYARQLFAVQPPSAVYDEARRLVALDWWALPVDVDAFRACLASGFPVAFGTRVTESFVRASQNGAIAMPGRDDRDDARHGRHAMLLVGYDDAARVFVVRNSWGADWGDQGYCYVPYPYVGNRDWTRNCWAIRLTHGEHDPHARPAVALSSLPTAPPSGRGGSLGAAGVVGGVAGVGAEVAVRALTGSGLLGGLVGGLVTGITPGIAASVAGARGRDPGTLAGDDRSETILAAMRAGGPPSHARAPMPWDDGLDEKAAKTRLTHARDVRAGVPEGRGLGAARTPEAAPARAAPRGAGSATPAPARPPRAPVVQPSAQVAPTPPAAPVTAAPSTVAPVEPVVIPEVLLRVWNEHGGAAGSLGPIVAPPGTMVEGAARGVVLRTAHGGIFDWDDDRAPFVMRDTDALFVRWVSLGAGRSAVGWPTSAPQWHG